MKGKNIVEEKLYTLELSYKELSILLDGSCVLRDKTQKVIDEIKHQRSFNFEIIEMGEILSKSLRIGKFTWIYM